MILRPPSSTRPDTPVPNTTLFRSAATGMGLGFGAQPITPIAHISKGGINFSRDIVRYSGLRALNLDRMGCVVGAGFLCGDTVICGRDRKSTRLNSSH